MVQADLSLPVPVEWAEAGTVEKLTIFPVKSCMGTVVQEAQVRNQSIEKSSFTGTSPSQATKEGLRSRNEGGRILVDRHFMVADAKNRLVSGRKYSQMVLIEPELARDAERRDVLVLKAPGMDELSVRLPRTEDMGAMQEETVDVGGWFLT